MKPTRPGRTNHLLSPAGAVPSPWVNFAFISAGWLSMS